MISIKENVVKEITTKLIILDKIIVIGLTPESLSFNSQHTQILIQ